MISHDRANYHASSDDPFDLSGSLNRTNHPLYAIGAVPYTSPVQAFSPNGYGLYDMGGNLWQWCWDWYGNLTGGSNPRGTGAGSVRVLRGGSWTSYGFKSRCAQRAFNAPADAGNSGGFRAARGNP
jgi:formylglycine-generating enzyme required for sulfatase activity